MHRATLDRHVGPRAPPAPFRGRRTINDDQLRTRQSALDEIVEQRRARQRLAFPAHGLDRQQRAWARFWTRWPNQAMIIALRRSAQQHKLRVVEFDGHVWTLAFREPADPGPSRPRALAFNSHNRYRGCEEH